MSLEKQAVKSVFWVGISKFGGQALSWCITLLLIRILAPSDYGLMGMALSYKLIVSIFFDMSIGEAVLRKKSLTDIDINTGFWICFTFSVILYAITWVAAIGWAHFFSSPELIKIIRVIGLSLIFLSIKEIPNRLMARDFEFKKRSLCELYAGFICMGICLGMALAGYGVWSLVISEVVRDFTLMLFIVLYKKWVPKFSFSISSAAQMLKYGLPVTGHYLLDYFSNRMDVILIGKVLGQNILGYYSVALSLSKMPVNKGVFIIQGVVFPLFSKLQDDIIELKKYYYMIIYLVSLFCFPVFLGMYAIAEDIIMIILSPKWLPSLFCFKIFCLIGILLSFKGIFLVILKSRGNTKPIFMFSIYSAIFLPIGFVMMSKYGLIGMAMTWMVIYPFLFIYLFYNVLIDIQANFTESIKRISHALAGALLMVVTIFLMKLYIFKNTVSLLNMNIYIATGIVVYISYFYIFSRKTFKDIQRIIQLLKS